MIELPQFPLRGTKLIYAISFSSAICFICFGYDQGVFGGLVNSAAFGAQFNNPNADTISNLTATYPLGCLLGCFISIMAGVQLGRKRTILVGCSLVTIGGALQASAFGIPQLYIGRVIAGTGTGLTSSAAPMWLSECAGAATRGRHVAILLAINAAGVFQAYWLDWGTVKDYPTSQFGWRFPLSFQCFYSMLGISLILFLPESPRLLYAKGRLEEADAILLRLLDCTEEDSPFLTQRQEIVDNLAVEAAAIAEQPLWRALLWDNSPLKNSRRFWIVVTMQTLQQMGGINAVAYYENTILLDSVGLPTEQASLLAGAAATSLFVGTLISIYTIEAWGRRKSLLIGSALTTVFMLALTVSLKFALTNKTAGWVAYSFILLYQISFGIAWDAIPWVYAPEISPVCYRHANSSAAVGAEWLFTFVTVKVLPVGIASVGWKIYIVWTVFNLAEFVFTYFFVHETKGKTLEEIDYMFSGIPSAGKSPGEKDVEEIEHVEVAKGSQGFRGFQLPT